MSKILETENDLTISKIQNIIKEKWNTEYTYTGVKNLLKNQFNLDINEYIDYTPKSNKTNDATAKDINELNLQDNDLNSIINLIHNEKEVFVYRKLLSFLLQNLGYSLDNISKIIGITTETLITWNKQWDEGGYEALLKKRGQGRKSKLSDVQWEEIRKIMGERNDWTLPEIAEAIEIRYGVRYSLTHLAQLLKKN